MHSFIHHRPVVWLRRNGWWGKLNWKTRWHTLLSQKHSILSQRTLSCHNSPSHHTPSHNTTQHLMSYPHIIPLSYHNTLSHNPFSHHTTSSHDTLGNASQTSYVSNHSFHRWTVQRRIVEDIHYAWVHCQPHRCDGRKWRLEWMERSTGWTVYWIVVSIATYHWWVVL